MSRVGEMFITFFGFIVYGLITTIGGFTVWMHNNQDKVEEMLDNVEEPASDLSKGEFLQLINEIGNSGWLLIIGSVIALIAGIVAIFLLRKNTQAKIAGYILIGSAIVSTLMTFGIAIFGAIIYIIAGIMCLVRKPKDILTL